MAAKVPTKRQPLPYTGVVQLVNSFCAVHVDGDLTTFISEHPETDEKVAFAAASKFAQEQKIVYQESLLTINPPPITIHKEQETWYPAQIYPDKLVLLKVIRIADNAGVISRKSLGGTREEATACARKIAAESHTNFLPNLNPS